MQEDLKPSEFEGPGPKPSAFTWFGKAWEKLRLIYRTDQEEDPDSTSDNWGKGGEIV